MSDGHVPARRLAVAPLVVEEHVGLVGAQEGPLVAAAEKKALVEPDVPGAQGLDDPLVGGCAAGRDEGRADGTGIFAELALQPVQAFEERLEGSSLQRAVGRLGLGRSERFEALFLEDPFGLVGEQHRIAVEGDLEGLGRVGGLPRTEQRGRCNAALQGPGDVLGLGGQEQIAAERLRVGIGTRSGGEGRTHDVQVVGGDGIEDAQARVRRVPRQQDDVDAAFAKPAIDVQQLGDEGESFAGVEHFVLVFDLVAAVGLEPLFAKHGVRSIEVEQSPGGYGDGEERFRVRHRGRGSTGFPASQWNPST